MPARREAYAYRASIIRDGIVGPSRTFGWLRGGRLVPVCGPPAYDDAAGAKSIASRAAGESFARELVALGIHGTVGFAERLERSRYNHETGRGRHRVDSTRQRHEPSIVALPRLDAQLQRQAATDPDHQLARRTVSSGDRASTRYRRRRAVARGVVLDFEDQSPADLPILVRVASAIADSAKAHGAAFAAIALPAADTAGYPTRAFIPALDLVVIMLYDEHWSTSAPGPVATPDWVRRTLARRLSDVGASRVVAALPLYGYLWRGNRPAEAVSFADARRAAFEANVELVRDPASLSLHAIQPGRWELWMSDAHLLRALRAEVNSLGVSRVALWRLGLEDPGVWSVFDR